MPLSIVDLFPSVPCCETAEQQDPKVLYETIKLCRHSNHYSIEYQKNMKKAVLFPAKNEKDMYHFKTYGYFCASGNKKK